MNQFQRPVTYGSGDIRLNASLTYARATQYDLVPSRPAYYLGGIGRPTCVHNVPQLKFSQTVEFNKKNSQKSKRKHRPIRAPGKIESINKQKAPKTQESNLEPKIEQTKFCEDKTNVLSTNVTVPSHYKTWRQRYWRVLNNSYKYKARNKNSEWEIALALEKKSIILKNHIHRYKDVYNKLRYLLIEYSKKIENTQRFPGDIRRFEKHWLCLSRTLKEQKLSIFNLENTLNAKNEAFDHLTACLERSEATSAYRKTVMGTLKNEISEALAQKQTAENDLLETQATNKKLTAQCKNLTTQIEVVEEKLKHLKDINDKLDENFRAQMDFYELEKTSCHVECKAKTHETLVKMSGVYQKHLVDVSNKQALSDVKIKEFYSTIEKIIKGIHGFKFENEIQALSNSSIVTSDDASSKISGAGEIIPKLVEWLKICNDMVFKYRFADDLSKFILNLMYTPQFYDSES